MNLRLTAIEAAGYLGRRKHWVYNTIPKICDESIYDSKFITVETLEKLMRFAFLSRTYESYPFNEIPVKKFTKALNECKRLEDLKDIVKNKTDYAEILLALKASKPNTDMFNLISYTRRKLGAEDWMNGDTLKEYVYDSLRKLVVTGKQDLSVLIPYSCTEEEDEERAIVITKEFADEITKELTELLKANN